MKISFIVVDITAKAGNGKNDNLISEYIAEKGP